MKGLARVPALIVAVSLGAAVCASEKTSRPAAARERPLYALGDVHGRIDLATAALSGAGLLDESLRWTGGDARLVLLGDFVDKGPDSRALLDLLMRLEKEAGRAGGELHVLLGNHELMNLIGDLRFTHEGEFRAFASEEREKDREAAFTRLTRHGALTAEQRAAARAEFDERFPPGYFAHRRAFSRRGDYGRWLVDRDAMVVIAGTVFVHAGLSPATAELGVDQLNRMVRRDLSRLLAAMETLQSASVIGPETPYSLVPRIAEHIAGGDVPADLPAALQARVQRAAREILELRTSPTLRLDGPLWYRGSALGEEIEEGPFLRGALATLGAERVVVGHTPTHTGRVMPRLGGRVIRLDTGRHDEGRSEPLPLLGLAPGEPRVFYPGEDWAPLLGEQPTLALAGLRGPVEALEQFLESARITSIQPIGEGRHAPKMIVLELDGVARRAVFRSSDEGRSAFTELAAYRLSHLLGLTLVPPTTWRDVEGVAGSLQLWVEGSIDERARRSEVFPGSRDAAIGERLRAASVFDALLGIEVRDPEDILFTPENWELWLIDHEDAFPADPGPPTRYQNLRIENELAVALEALDRETLAGALRGLLEARQIETLLVRRDELLAGAR